MMPPSFNRASWHFVRLFIEADPTAIEAADPPLNFEPQDVTQKS
jgi:hypothetical protein